MVLDIAQLGQPVLRKVAVEIPVQEIRSAKFQKFADDMLETVIKARGAGLAGPQVFAGKRIFIAKVLPAETKDGDRQYDFFINPKITPVGEKYNLAWEGCLSFEELLVLVPRFVTVRIDYLNRHAEPKSLELENWPARIVQHEFDHLEGVLTIDRAPLPRYIIKASEIEAASADLDSVK